jgi:hypothetical protein
MAKKIFKPEASENSRFEVSDYRHNVEKDSSDKETE